MLLDASCQPAGFSVLKRSLCAVACAIALGAGMDAALAGPAATGGSHAIAWQVVAAPADVDKAFALARSSGKPVFLYWGAVWCPPCNQVKATLFARPDFVERSRAFVPVYVDGDKAGAQKVAARFKVSGYPTMIVFKPDGTEVTRLPGEVDPERYLMAMSAGLNAQVPVKELVQRALARQALTSEQWHLLAFYSWDTDEQQLVAASQLPERLEQLAAATPPGFPDVRNRLAFKSLAARAEADSPGDPATVSAGRSLAERVLTDEAATGQLADIVVGQGEALVKYLAPDPAPRRELAGHWDRALARLIQSGLSNSDLVDALDTRVAMWKFIDGSQELAPARRAEVMREVATIVARTTDRYERQAVVPGAAHTLTDAGLVDESDELLKFELPRAVAPYYHMLGLAGNAKKRNDPKAALAWYEQAWRTSQGEATRIQWGANYVGRVAELTPDDVARVDRAANSLIAQLKPRSDTFYERNVRTLTRMVGRLRQWQGTKPDRIRVVEKLEQRFGHTCAQLPARDEGRANCEKVFWPKQS